MKLYAFDIPDDPAHLPAWLERHLTGLDLASLVAELSAVHGSAVPSDADLNRLLGTQKRSVLDQGLRALSPEALRQLLLHPRLLLDLQEVVLREGGSYWTTIAPDTEHLAHVQRGAEKLRPVLAHQAALAAPKSGPRRRWYQRSWFASLATAAALLAMFFAYERLRQRPLDKGQRPDSAAWGWNKPDALPTDVSRATYLNRLADEAGEWFEERPTAAVAVARRIQELRAGCSRLIFAEHKPLPPADRQWLIENCRVWGRKLDKQLAALESGQNALEVRTETDDLIHHMIDDLRLRAQNPA